MNKVDQRELGKQLYRDWANSEDGAGKIIKGLGKENVSLNELKQGFIEERRTEFKFEDETEENETFYAALDEIGTPHWYKEEKDIVVRDRGVDEVIEIDGETFRIDQLSGKRLIHFLNQRHVTNIKIIPYEGETYERA